MEVLSAHNVEVALKISRSTRWMLSDSTLIPDHPYSLSFFFFFHVCDFSNQSNGQMIGEIGRLEGMRYFSAGENGFGRKDRAKENIGHDARSRKCFLTGNLVITKSSKGRCHVLSHNI